MRFFGTDPLEKSWPFFGTVFTLLAALTLWPFIANEYPGMSDYANHLARLHLLTGHAVEGWQKYYSVDHALIPNLALDVIAGALVKLGLSPELALRIFTAVTNLILVFGVATISWVVNKRPPWLTLLIFPLAFNRYYVWGFLNYFFAVGLSLLLFAFYIYSKKFEKKYKLTSELITSLMLMIILLSHLMGYAIALLCIGVYELRFILLGKDWLERLKMLTRCSLVVVPSLFIYVFLCEHSTTKYPIVYQDVFQSKMSGLLSPFLSYQLKLIPLYVAGLFLSLWFALSSKTRTLRENFIRAFPNYTGFVPLALFVVFLIAPSAMMNSYFLDKRLFTVVIYLALGLMVYQVNTGRASLMITIVFILHAAKVFEVNQIWAEQSKGMKEIIKALDSVKIGSKIESYNFTDDELMPLPPLQHAVSAAIYKRATFVPTVFAKPVNAESIVMNPPYDAWGYSNGTYKYTYSGLHMRNVCKNGNFYEYVMITFINTIPKVPSCAEPIKKGRYFILYQVHATEKK